MPELPEVEVVKRGVERYTLNKKIVRLHVLCAKSFQNEISQVRTDKRTTKIVGSKTLQKDNPEYIVVPINAKIIGLRRFGKALVIDLDNGRSLMVHLRMTGQLIYEGKERFAAGHPSENFVAELPNKQTRVIFDFDDDTHLFFNDQRKFGFVKLLKTTEVENDPFIQKLAKEPWDMSAAEFYEMLQRHQKAPIKAVILDQSNIAGLGNIYADEALFASKIHPARLAGSLSKTEAKTLLNNAARVMQLSIDSGGSTMATYVKADGSRGHYLEKFAQVFRKDGENCPRCGTKIIKIRCAGRGTHLCPNCQKETK